MGRSEAYGAHHQRDRRNWNQELEANGPRPCPRCDDLVYPDSRADLNPDGRKFDLGHRTDVAFGGIDGPKTPEHACCSRSAGAHTRELLKALNDTPRLTRDW